MTDEASPLTYGFLGVNGAVGQYLTHFDHFTDHERARSSGVHRTVSML